MKYSTQRGKFGYVFERQIATNKARSALDVSYSDTIKLIRVVDWNSFGEINIDAHKASLPLSAWADLIAEVKRNTCGLCGERCGKDGCENIRYHGK